MADGPKQSTKPAHCLFCEHTELTKEHLWPNWIVEEFKLRSPPRRGLYRATQLRSDGRRLDYTTGSIERKEPLVCDPCNSGWMSQVETCAIPILTPLIFGPITAKSYGPRALCTLAAWFTLRSIVFDGTFLPAHRYYLPADRKRFAHDAFLSPARHTFLWLALYRGNEQYAARHYVHNWITADGENLHVFTGLIHTLAIKFVTWKGEKRSFRADSIASWGNVTRRVWPYRKRKVDWPPPHSLTSEGFETFRHWLMPRKAGS